MWFWTLLTWIAQAKTVETFFKIFPFLCSTEELLLNTLVHIILFCQQDYIMYDYIN